MAKHKISDKYKHHKEAPTPKGRLLAIGGSESKSKQGEGQNEEQVRNKDFESEEILQFFKNELSGNDPLVVLVTTASTEPEQMVKDYTKVFGELGINRIEVLDIRNRQDARDEKYLNAVNQANGIYFTGGDQLRLTSILGGTPVLQLIKERFTYDDILVAGTSAGAMALSTPMIYEVMTQGGFIKGDVRITTGLEFIKDVAFDTHFIQRGRIVRMAQCIVTNPGCIGIGLEEDTAVYINQGNEMEVLGSGLVTVVDGMGLSCTDIYSIGSGEPFSVRDLRVHMLAKGQKYTITKYDSLHT